MVAAYKSVVKEKEALEASLSALNSGSSIANVNETDSEKKEPLLGDEEGEKRDDVDPLGVNKQVFFFFTQYLGTDGERERGNIVIWQRDDAVIMMGRLLLIIVIERDNNVIIER